MRNNPYYALDDVGEIKRIIRENPWATLVSKASTGLVGSHYPILLEEDGEELSIVTHVGRPDERVHELGEHELMVVVQGPHGYVSSSWYGADLVEVPTWNFITAHLSGMPEILEPEENFEVLTRLVGRFEGAVSDPRLLDGTDADAENARRDSRGTVGLRIRPERIVAKQKMSQNKPPEILRTIIEELEGEGPYANRPLAREMRIANGLPGG